MIINGIKVLHPEPGSQEDKVWDHDDPDDEELHVFNAEKGKSFFHFIYINNSNLASYIGIL